MIEFECPGCNALTKVEDHLAGTEYECRQCQALLEIPTLEEFADQPNASNPTEYVGTPVDEERPRRSGPSSTSGLTDEPETVTVGGKPANCAIHPDQAASGICKRCGNFQCNICSKKGWFKACPSCREKGDSDRPFALSRRNYSVGQWLNLTWELFTPNAWPLIGMVLIVWVISFALSFGMSIINAIGQASGAIVIMALFQITTNLLSNLFTQCLDVGVMGATLDGTNKRGIDVGKMFQFFHRFGAVFISGLTFGLIMAVPMVFMGMIGGAVGAASGDSDLGFAVFGFGAFVFLLPLGIWFGIPFSLINVHLAENPKVGGWEAFWYVMKLANGHRFTMFLTYFVVGLISIPIILFTVCIGSIPVAGYGFMLRAVMYRTLVNGYEES